MSLIDELYKVKKDLLELKTGLEEKTKDLNRQDFKEKRITTNISKINNLNDIVTFNIGGEIYKLNKKIFDNHTDTLFWHIINSGEFDLSQEVFIDRDPFYFNLIIDRIKGTQINYRLFKNKQDFNLFRREVEFYNLLDEIDFIEARMKNVKMVGFSFSGPYIKDGVTAGTNIIEDIVNPNGNTGICAKAPGWIIIELNDLWQFEELIIGGYRGNKSFWFPDNGVGAEISISTDNYKWIPIGNIPPGFGTENKSIKVCELEARYIKFSCSSYIGIGYLQVVKKELIIAEKEEVKKEKIAI